MQEINIPDSVTAIGDYAFYGCDNLASIYFYGDAPQFYTEVLGNVTATAYYPAGNATWTDDVKQDYGGTITWVEWIPNGNGALTFDESSYSCNVGETIYLTAAYVSEEAPTEDNIIWTCSDKNAVSFSDTSTQGPSVTGEENTYWISTAITGLTAGNTTITLSVFGCSTSVSVTVNGNESMGIGVLTAIDDNLNYIFIDDDKGYIAAESEFAKMKELLNNKKISDKRVIFKYTDNDVIISIYSIYDVLCLQAKNVQASPEKLEYSTDGTYQKDTIEVTADVFVTVDLSQDAPYSPSDIGQLKETDLYFNLEDITLTAFSASNIVYFGKTLWMKSTKKEIETNATTIGYGQNRSISLTVSADIDDDAEPEETSATVLITKFFASVAGDSYSIAFADCYVEVTNQCEVEKESTLDALAKSYENADITVGLSANLNQYFADGSNGGADDVAVIEYIVKMLTLETISSYNNAEDWAERLENLAAEKLRNALLSKLGLSSSVIGGTDTVYVYAQYTGTNDKTVDLKIPVAIYMQGDKIYGGTGTILYSTDGKKISNTSKNWNIAGTLTYVNMSNFADCMINYVKAAYNQAWGKSANKWADTLVGAPLTNLFKAVKRFNDAAKILNINVKLPTSTADAIFQFSLNQVKKSASIECPVDVYVYNSYGQICGAIEDNAINPYFSDESVVLSVVGDKKYVTLYNDNYSILFVGNGRGTMKYQIDEYADGELVRSVTTVDIPLEEGTVYCGYIPESLYTSTEIYELIGEDEDETIPVTSDEYFVHNEVAHTEGEAVIENENSATCINDGSYDRVVYCIDCGEEISRETIIIPATGHSYATPVFTWSDDYTSATATFTCTDCDDEQTINCTVTSETNADEGTMYIATVEFNGATYTDTQTIIMPVEPDVPDESDTSKPNESTESNDPAEAVEPSKSVESDESDKAKEADNSTESNEEQETKVSNVTTTNNNDNGDSSDTKTEIDENNASNVKTGDIHN